MKRLVFGLCLMMLAAPPAAAAGLQMSIRNGRVTLDAQDVTVRQILTEWARIGKTQIVNAERISGGPVTLKLQDVPEKQALDIILRTVPGYMARPRETFVADASIYDRILVMATTAAVAAGRPQTPAAFPGMQGTQPGPNFTQLRPPQPALTPGAMPEPEDQSEDPAIAAAAAAGLVPVPAPNPTQISAPLMLPGVSQAPPAQSAPGTAASPSNPTAPAGTSTAPTFTPPPPPATSSGVTTTPITRPRPPQPDR
jgi:hypothetical protein